MIPKLIITTLMTSFFVGCSVRSDLSHIEVRDPESGMITEIIVRRGGLFEENFKNDTATVSVNGTVARKSDRTYEISFNFERVKRITETRFEKVKIKYKASGLPANEAITIDKTRYPEKSDSTKEGDVLSVKLVSANSNR